MTGQQNLTHNMKIFYSIFYSIFYISVGLIIGVLLVRWMNASKFLGIAINSHITSTSSPGVASSTLVATGSGYSTTSIQGGTTDLKGSFTGVVSANAGQLELKFANAYTYAPVCVASIVSAQPTTTFYVTSSVSGIGLNFIAGNVSGTKSFNYICIQ